MARVVAKTKMPAGKTAITPEVLGQFIRAKRTQEGLRLEDVALLCGMAKDTFSKIENGQGGARLDNVLRVCQMLGLELMIKPWDENHEAQ